MENNVDKIRDIIAGLGRFGKEIKSIKKQRVYHEFLHELNDQMDKLLKNIYGEVIEQPDLDQENPL